MITNRTSWILVDRLSMSWLTHSPTPTSGSGVTATAFVLVERFAAVLLVPGGFVLLTGFWGTSALIRSHRPGMFRPHSSS